MTRSAEPAGTPGAHHGASAAAAQLAGVGRVVLVVGGKGGVGKSYVAAALALAAASRDRKRVALLDGDWANPGSARMLGAEGPLRTTANGIQLATGHSGVRVFAGDLMPPGAAPKGLAE